MIFMKKIVLFPLLLLCGMIMAQPKLQLVNFSTGFDLPLDVTHCGDSRLFVVEREGVIWVLDSLGNKLNKFLDIDPVVNSNQNEQGLLGLAFHPNYAENGYFFVDYTKNSGGTTRISRYSVKPDNPNEADPNSELTILEQTQPYWNHNGGCLKFGPDGYLYISLGDGGSGGDPQNYGQNKKTFLGKILRVDVNNSSASEPYIVPSDNPFVGNTDYFPEIWSTGWRNPWRFSFDRLTGDLWIADVGQNQWEEIDFEPANTPGLNYGWRCYEGTHNFNTNNCQPASAYVSPVYEYSHSGGNGCSVTGGFVYRGAQFPDLYGCYLFADYCSGRWWYSRRNADGSVTTQVLATLAGYEYSSMGEGHNGELYVTLLSSGRVQRVRELCSPFQVTGAAGPGVCAGSMSGEITLNSQGAAGNVSYLWSNGATTQNISNLEPGLYNVTVNDGNNCTRRDTFQVADASPAAPIMTQIDTAVCQGQPINFNLPAPPTGYVYQWYFNGGLILGSSTGIFLAQNTGAYQVQLISPGCQSPISAGVLLSVFPNPTLNLSANSNVITANFLPANAGIQWFFEGTLIPNATNATLLADQNGQYEAEVTDLVGCTNRAEISIILIGTQVPEYVRYFSLSPNPTQNTLLLKLDLEQKGNCVMYLTDSSQRQILMQTFDSQSITHTIDLRNQPAGTYYLSVQTSQGGFVRKVVKQ